MKNGFLACYEKCLEQYESAVDVFTVEDVDCAICLGLDVAKVFDSINHYGIFIELMNVHVSFCVLNTLVNWYGKFSGSVRLAGVLFQQFSMRSVVREGSVISPLLFSLYISDLIVLRSQGYGCYLGDMFVGCLLFVDDILLVSASVLQLQFMLNICYEYCNEWGLQFNVKKSTVMVVGKGSNALLSAMMLGDGVMNSVREST